jgi:hypothetical protein
MWSRSWIAMGVALLGLLANSWTRTVVADDHDHEHRHGHKHVRSTQATPHTMEQAGYPQMVSPLAMESYNEHYSGGYIGGGKAWGGHAGCANAGTWGWDYSPFHPMSSRIFLKWSHGRHYQGGTGAYATDGPKPLEHITETIHSHFGGGD